MRALARGLASGELLARVDVLCLDKTGTITTGEIAFADLETIGATSRTEAEAAVGAMAGVDPSPNATLAALAAALDDPGWSANAVVPFSSARKWAAADFGDHGTLHPRAPAVLLPAGAWAVARDRLPNRPAAGQRVMLLTPSAPATSDPAAPPPPPVAAPPSPQRTSCCPSGPHL